MRRMDVLGVTRSEVIGSHTVTTYRAKRFAQSFSPFFCHFETIEGSFFLIIPSHMTFELAITTKANWNDDKKRFKCSQYHLPKIE